MTNPITSPHTKLLLAFEQQRLGSMWIHVQDKSECKRLANSLRRSADTLGGRHRVSKDGEFVYITRL